MYISRKVGTSVCLLWLFILLFTQDSVVRLYTGRNNEDIRNRPILFNSGANITLQHSQQINKNMYSVGKRSEESQTVGKKRP